MDEVGAPGAAAGLQRYVGVGRRRWPVVLLVTLAVTTVAVLVSLRKDTIYLASADVLLSRQDIARQLTGVGPVADQSDERFVGTQVELARVPEVAQRAVKKANLPGWTAGRLLASSGVTPKANADILTFIVGSCDRAAPPRLATAYASAFTEYRSAVDTAALQKVIADVQRQLAALPRQPLFPDPASNGANDAPVDLLRQKLQQLRTVQALQTSNAVVVRGAGGAGEQGPKPFRSGLAGAAMGLLLGAGLALLLEALDTRVRSDDDIEQQLDLPVVGRLPSTRSLVMLERPQSADAEPFRILRTNVELGNLGAQARSILVSAAQDEAQDTPMIVANLALSLARASRHVVLVDLDVRRSAVDALLGADGRPGLTDVVLGRLELDEAVLTVRFDDNQLVPVDASTNGKGSPHSGLLEVLPVGATPPTVAEFLATSSVLDMVRSLRERGDLLLVHGPPLLGTSDGLTLSTIVDGLVIVIRSGLVRRRTLTELRRTLGTVPARTLGIIISGASETPRRKAAEAKGRALVGTK